MEWVIACDQPFEEVDQPEFIAIMNYTHRAADTSLKLLRRNGIKRCLMAMGEETIKEVQSMFSI